MIDDKIKNLSQLKKIVADLRKKGKRVAFTNGCFDILHLGHVSYLEEAKNRADVLIVAINSNDSVGGIKGDNRPVVDESDRAKVVAGLESVDYVTIFDELTPLTLIETLRPDVLVKGDDWKPDEVVGRDVVESYGGRVITVTYLKNYSTRSIIQTIAERFG